MSLKRTGYFGASQGEIKHGIWTCQYLEICFLDECFTSSVCLVLVIMFFNFSYHNHQNITAFSFQCVILTIISGLMKVRSAHFLFQTCDVNDRRQLAQ